MKVRVTLSPVIAIDELFWLFDWIFTWFSIGNVLSKITWEELDVVIIGSLSSPTESVINISKLSCPSVSKSVISYWARYFSDPKSEIVIACPFKFTLWDINNSLAIKFIEIISPTLAHVESWLLDAIRTISNSGLVLSNITMDPSVVAAVPLFGLPDKSKIPSTSKGITPSESPFCIA